jgi:hypothetical protein
MRAAELARAWQGMCPLRGEVNTSQGRMPFLTTIAGTPSLI